jgi:hypothetical protein
LIRAGSPVTVLGLSQARRAIEYHLVASSNLEYVDLSSFLSAQSSILGILGDYGIAGFLAAAGLAATLVRALWRSGSSLAPAAIAGWAIALPLGLLFDWLEQPPFMLLLALTTGLALTDPSTRKTAKRRAPHGAYASA